MYIYNIIDMDTHSKQNILLTEITWEIEKMMLYFIELYPDKKENKYDYDEIYNNFENFIEKISSNDKMAKKFINKNNLLFKSWNNIFLIPKINTKNLLKKHDNLWIYIYNITNKISKIKYPELYKKLNNSYDDIKKNILHDLLYVFNNTKILKSLFTNNLQNGNIINNIISKIKEITHGQEIGNNNKKIKYLIDDIKMILRHILSLMIKSNIYKDTYLGLYTKIIENIFENNNSYFEFFEKWIKFDEKKYNDISIVFEELTNKIKCEFINYDLNNKCTTECKISKEKKNCCEQKDVIFDKFIEILKNYNLNINGITSTQLINNIESNFISDEKNGILQIIDFTVYVVKYLKDNKLFEDKIYKDLFNILLEKMYELLFSSQDKIEKIFDDYIIPENIENIIVLIENNDLLKKLIELTENFWNCNDMSDILESLKKIISPEIFDMFSGRNNNDNNIDVKKLMNEIKNLTL